MLQINRQAGVGVIVLANGPANTGNLALRSLDILSK
jgi:hypothetical protein